jgi:uncharacterized membrane protein (DUF106 family)
MESFLDTLWEYIAVAFQFCGQSLYGFLENFHAISPAALIALLAIATVAVTKLLNRFIVTKRYLELEKEFHYWVEIRQEAMKYEDNEKGKRMARNIDQAKLNRVYYDYFFEGLLLGIARKIIPIFFMFAFINEFYRPTQMLQIFGREYVLQLPSTNGETILVGAVFWYFICILGGYLFWSLVVRLLPLFRMEPRRTLEKTVEKPNC